MAAACLREDRWLVHDLAVTCRSTELIGFAAETGAALIVLSSATPDAARAAGREAREIRQRLPHVRVLTGRPGDTLTRLRELARAPDAPAAQANPKPLSRTDPSSSPRIILRQNKSIRDQWPAWPSMTSRTRSSWPLWRAYTAPANAR